jgi:hypothetical protein
LNVFAARRYDFEFSEASHAGVEVPLGVGFLLLEGDLSALMGLSVVISGR